jgi:hypothetical protein
MDDRSSRLCIQRVIKSFIVLQQFNSLIVHMDRAIRFQLLNRRRHSLQRETRGNAARVVRLKAVY